MLFLLRYSKKFKLHYPVAWSSLPDSHRQLLRLLAAHAEVRAALMYSKELNSVVSLADFMLLQFSHLGFIDDFMLNKKLCNQNHVTNWHCAFAVHKQLLLRLALA
ncbi:hypothetical protein [Kosakonia sp. Marseille-Q7440]